LCRRSGLSGAAWAWARVRRDGGLRGRLRCVLQRCGVRAARRVASAPPPTGVGRTRGRSVDEVINPVVLYLGCLVGAGGLALALPRVRNNLQMVGFTLAGAAVGLVLVSLGWRANAVGQLPSVYFYGFSGLALLSAVRMITHPRPVYSALYFIASVLSTSGLYLLLSAEFMAFALIIIYAGAILITYLFVIMLATQAPGGPGEDDTAPEDAESREPAIAAGAGFVLLAALSTMLFAGASRMPAPGELIDDARLAEMPRRVETVLRDRGLLEPGEVLTRAEPGVVQMTDRVVVAEDGFGGSRLVALPSDLVLRNTEAVGVNLLREHPGTIEIAGVILLMAMLGATVLARKRIELGEDEDVQRVLGGEGGDV